MVAKKKDKTPAERPVKYPNRLKSAVGELITVKKAVELLGWITETDDNKFGADYLLEVGKTKVRCLNNVTNRPLYMSNVETLKRDILNQSWQYNAEPIIIGRTGLVLNGQHTLVAIILAEEERLNGKDKEYWQKLWGKNQITIDKDITYGVSEEDIVVNTMDTCKPRTLMDVLYRSEYFKDLPNSERKTVARACSFAIQLLWQRAGGYAGGHVGAAKGKHTHAEYLDFLERHPKLLDAVRHIHQENANDAISKYLTVGYSSACMYLMAASATNGEEYHNSDIKSEKLIDFEHWEKARGFWVSLASGTEDFKGVRYALGELEDLSTGMKASKDEIIAVLALAWDQYRDDKIPTEQACKLEKSEPDPDGNRHVVSWPDFGGIDKGHEIIKEAKDTEQDPDAGDNTGAGTIADHEEVSPAKPKVQINKGPDPEALRAEMKSLKDKNPGKVLLIRNPEAWVLWEEDAETYLNATGKKIVERGGLKFASFKPEELEINAKKLVEYGEKLAMCYPPTTKGQQWQIQDYNPIPTKSDASQAPSPVAAKPGGKKTGDVVKPTMKPGMLKPGGKK